MAWQIREYESIRKERLVTEFIQKQKPKTIAKIIHLVDLLEEYGPKLALPHAKKLDTFLYELRIRGKEEIRILYGFNGKTIYLLHGFKKQTQKTPVKELDTARQRFMSVKKKIASMLY